MPLVLGIAGHSGAGKTTLIERLLPRLASRGWRVGVLKHDAHQLHLDREGKDTARFFEAGAAMVCAHDPSQWFVRARSDGPVPLSEVISGLPVDLDLVLVEGHKNAPIDKIVLAHPEPRDPIVGPQVLDTVAWGEQRLEQVEQRVASWLEQAWRDRPFGVAIFVGGRARRMGLPKCLLAYEGRSVAEHIIDSLGSVAGRIVTVGDPAASGREAERSLGAGDSTGANAGAREATRATESALRMAASNVLDAPEVDGPLGGLLGLLRHDPSRSWLVVGCDQPGLGVEHVAWLRQARRPGAWVVLPQLAGRARPEPFGAIVEPELRAVLERAAARGVRALHEALAGAPLAQVTPPATLAGGWRSANTPEQWQELTGVAPRLAR